MLAKPKNDKTKDGDRRSDLLDLVDQIGSSLAAANADDVDAQARFPGETFQALRDASVLSAAVPIELGGAGCGISVLAEMCTSLARHCASSGMILAMHHIQVLAIVDHRGDVPELDDYLRDLVREQRLIASATSEVGTGGDLGRSIACLKTKDDRFEFEKAATTISYGEEADDLLVTLRRSDQAAAADQILVLVRRDEFELDEIGSWDTLGMRGTCSPPAIIRGEGAQWQILGDSFRTIRNTTMVPVSHVLWAAVWIGIATDAFDRARRVVQAQMRKDPDGSTLAAAHLASLATKLHAMQSQLESVGLRHAERIKLGPSEREMDFGEALRANDLKLAASEAVIEIVHQAIMVAGIAAYRNGGDSSLGRHLRDAHSAPLMINNDRIRGANMDLLLVYKGS